LGALPVEKVRDLAPALPPEGGSPPGGGEQADVVARPLQGRDRAAEKEEIPEPPRADEEQVQGTSTRAVAELPSRS
jgi:hypothetical protein